MLRPAVLFTLACMLAACGLKGDLYLPAPEPAATAPEGEPPGDADDEEQEPPRVPATPGPEQRR